VVVADRAAGIDAETEGQEIEGNEPEDHGGDDETEKDRFHRKTPSGAVAVLLTAA
jgi:hypothetical protein